MGQFFIDLVKEPLFAVSGWVITLLGIPLSYMFARVTQRKRDLWYSRKTQTIVSRPSTEFSELTIEYRGEKIEKLFQTRWCLWNSGHEPVRRTDIAERDPIVLEFDTDTRIFSADIEFSSDAAVNASLAPLSGEPRVSVDFDFLDFRHCVMVSILHSSLGRKRLVGRGTIVGMGKVRDSDRALGPIALVGLAIGALGALGIVGTIVYSLFSFILRTLGFSFLERLSDDTSGLLIGSAAGSFIVGMSTTFLTEGLALKGERLVGLWKALGRRPTRFDTMWRRVRAADRSASDN